MYKSNWISFIILLLGMISLLHRGVMLGQSPGPNPSSPSTISQLEAKAQAGDPGAQVALGKAYEAGRGVPQSYVVTPAFGSLNVATPVSFPEGEGFGSLPDVWFGALRGTGAALGQAGVLTVTTPPSAQPGPVNIKVIEPDGTPIFNPLAYSYGPFPMFVDGDTATPPLPLESRSNGQRSA